MVLVDTSVWMRFLANRPPFAAQLDRLLDHGEVARHDLVYGELLIGDAGGRARLLESYSLLPALPDIPHAEVTAFVKAHRLHGKDIAWIDAHLLASAVVSGVPLWTADERLARLAYAMGVSYSGSP